MTNNTSFKNSLVACSSVLSKTTLTKPYMAREINTQLETNSIDSRRFTLCVASNKIQMDKNSI